jgi:hypothetical protein
VPFVGSTAVAKLPRWGGPPRPRLMTGMPRQALIQQPKSRASRPRPSGSDCLTLEVVPHELGANYTQNRKERQQERGWFGDRPWMIVAPDGFPNCHDSQTFAGGSWGAQACEIHVGRFEQDAGRQRSRQGKSVRLAKRITVGITGVDRHQAGAARGAAPMTAMTLLSRKLRRRGGETSM